MRERVARRCKLRPFLIKTKPVSDGRNIYPGFPGALLTQPRANPFILFIHIHYISQVHL